MSPSLNCVYHGRSERVLKTWAADFVDAVVTDPPYELGFMGKSWDSTGIAYSVPLWREVLRVMKPGAHLLAFGGTRTYHRMACAIEDAGFQIRDQIQWIHGQGFPKSLDISKAIDKMNGDKRPVIGKSKNGVGNTAKSLHKAEGFAASRSKEHDLTSAASAASAAWDGWGTALKPANEPIVLARKPLSEKTVAANVLKWGTGALNIEACRIEAKDGYSENTVTQGVNQARTSWSVADAPRKFEPGSGRWPANLITMHHPACADTEAGYACVPDCPMRIMDDQSGTLKSGIPMGIKAGGSGNAFGHFEGGIPVTGFGDSGGASRFFYCAKPDTGERNAGLEDGETQQRDQGRAPGRPGGENPRNRGAKAVSNFHPTVKPVDLMAYLIQLVTPGGGAVLDPFFGSGTTGIAAARLGHPWLGIEMEAAHLPLAEKRIAAETQQGRLL